MAIDTTSPLSRRAILLGALGGVAASVAATVGRADPVGATNGDAVHVGSRYSATAATEIDATGTNAFVGRSNSAVGVIGDSESGDGVNGYSRRGNGLYGVSMRGDGVSGLSKLGSGVSGSSSDQPGVFGRSFGLSSGVQGYSGFDTVPAAPSQTGVYGYANQDARAVGVSGASPQGRGATFSGGKAQLRLVPSSASSHPRRGALGDLFLDATGALWLCKGGTTWVRLA